MRRSKIFTQPLQERKLRGVINVERLYNKESTLGNAKNMQLKFIPPVARDILVVVQYSTLEFQIEDTALKELRLL